MLLTSRQQGDAGREKLEQRVLTLEQSQGALLSWRAEREAAVAEAAGAWLPAPSMSGAAALGAGGKGSDVSSDSDEDMVGAEDQHPQQQPGVSGTLNPVHHQLCQELSLHLQGSWLEKFTHACCSQVCALMALSSSSRSACTA